MKIAQRGGAFLSGELIDIGSNLTHDSFAADLPQVIRRAIEAGVTRQIVTGADLDSSRAAAAFAAAHPSTLWSTAGIHPHHAAQFDPARREELEELLREPRVVAVGECGLDYFRDFSPRPAQRAAFIAQLEIAARARQAGVSAPARRARGFRGHSRRAPSRPGRRGGALLHRRRARARGLPQSRFIDRDHGMDLR